MEDKRVELINAMAAKQEEIAYYTYLTNLLQRPEDAKAYEKKLTDMSVRATNTIDSTPETGEGLVSKVAEVKAKRAVCRELLSELAYAQPTLERLTAEYTQLHAQLKTLEIPKKKTGLSLRPPEK